MTYSQLKVNDSLDGLSILARIIAREILKSYEKSLDTLPAQELLGRKG